MNQKQKIILFACLLIIIVSIIIWIASGAEVFTKTQVLIEKKDELFGTNYKEWKDQFIWGLDLTGAITGFIVISGSLLLWIFRRKT